MTRILVVDDDLAFAGLLRKLLVKEGYEVSFAGTLVDARRSLDSLAFDLVLLDVHLPDGNGIDFLPGLLDMDESPEVLIITGNPNDDGARMAVERGAWDYICKVDPIPRIVTTTKNAIAYGEEKKISTIKDTLRDSGIIGRSKVLVKVLDQAARAAKSDAYVLITGETGTGKELFARAIHANSKRAGRQFVVVDCAAIPGELMESTLFGHKKGAFTGATGDHEGLVAMADGGTLFLDEIGELPLELQKVFLRVLQEKTFRPVGSRNEKTSDFRLIAATNKNLESMADAGTFRSDLYFRIKAFHLHLPPLRDRKGDIEKLAKYFLAKKTDESGSIKGFHPGIFEILEGYDWPGNVRELFNVIDATLANAAGFPTIFMAHLPTAVRVRKGFGASPATIETQKPKAPILEHETIEAYRGRVMDEAEKDYLTSLMARTERDIQQACQASGLSRSRLYVLLQKHGLPLKSSKKA